MVVYFAVCLITEWDPQSSYRQLQAWWNQPNDFGKIYLIFRTPPKIKEKIGVRFTVGEYEQKLAPYYETRSQRQKQLDQRAMVTQVRKVEQKN